MADTTDLFARRNRSHIIALVLLATLNSMLAVAGEPPVAEDAPVTKDTTL